MSWISLFEKECVLFDLIRLDVVSNEVHGELASERFGVVLLDDVVLIADLEHADDAAAVVREQHADN